MSRGSRNRSDLAADAEGAEEEAPGLPPGVTVEELQPGEHLLAHPVPSGNSPPESPPAPPTEDATVAEQTKPPKRYVVAPGRSLTVARGHLGEGAAIRATDLSLEQIRTFEASGHLVAR